jgi:fructose-bisphosphate aldolase, class I
VLCQSHDVVPVLEVEVTGAGDHGLTRNAMMMSTVLREVFRQLLIAGVDLSGVVLSPNLVLPGAARRDAVTSEDVAEATVR